MRSEGGVSLIEVLVGVMIAGLIMMISLPAIGKLQPRLELALTADQVTQDLALARLRAIERRVASRLAYSPGDKYYTLSPYVPSATPPTPTPWFKRDFPYKNVTLAPFPDVTFSSTGFLTPAATLNIVLTGRDDAGTRTVNVTVAGRARIKRP